MDQENQDREVFAEAKHAVNVKLNTPIQRGEMTIAEIVLNKPKPLNLRGLKIANILQLDVSEVSTVIQRCAMPPLTDQEVKRMDIADITKCGTELLGFFVTAEREE